MYIYTGIVSRTLSDCYGSRIFQNDVHMCTQHRTQRMAYNINLYAACCFRYLNAYLTDTERGMGKKDLD